MDKKQLTSALGEKASKKIDDALDRFTEKLLDNFIVTAITDAPAAVHNLVEGLEHRDRCRDSLAGIKDEI